jgi:hypothetical protein
MSAPKSLRVVSYFSRPTDLADAMRGWPEFVRGEGYDVWLRSPTTHEEVTVRLVTDEDAPHVIFTSSSAGELLGRVLGCSLCAMSENSDTLVINWA